jgi:urease accessory protein
LTDDLAFLRLLQISDSQFPTGSFAHSGGLETYAHLGLRPGDLEELLTHQIASGWGRLDLAAAGLAWTAAEDPATLEDLARRLDAWKVIPGNRQASLGLGQRTLVLARRVFPSAAETLDLSPPHHAVVIGALGSRLGAPQRLVLLAFGQTFLTAALAAATRCMPVSPGRAQEILVALQPLLAETVARIADAPDDALFCCTPALDIRTHQQAALHTRLFQS